MIRLKPPVRTENIIQNDFRFRKPNSLFYGICFYSYANYYNQTPTHLLLNKDAPVSRAIETVGHILPMPILDGLHHRYVRI